MWLKRISILNYKNLEQVELAFSKKLNCIIEDVTSLTDARWALV